MAIRSQKSLSSVNIWPGYVDVLATINYNFYSHDFNNYSTIF